MSYIDGVSFNKNPATTQNYCASQQVNSKKSNAEILRSINPEFGGQAIYRFERNTANADSYISAMWNPDPLNEEFLVTKLFELQMAFKWNILYRPSNECFGGKILAVEFEETVLDGASEAQPNGFIDVYDLPPIDTWFYLQNVSEKRILYPWVPDNFTELVQNGIEVNCLDLLYRVDDLYDDLSKLLRNY